MEHISYRFWNAFLWLPEPGLLFDIIKGNFIDWFSAVSLGKCQRAGEVAWLKFILRAKLYIGIYLGLLEIFLQIYVSVTSSKLEALIPIIITSYFSVPPKIVVQFLIMSLTITAAFLANQDSGFSQDSPPTKNYLFIVRFKCKAINLRPSFVCWISFSVSLITMVCLKNGPFGRHSIINHLPSSRIKVKVNKTGSATPLSVFFFLFCFLFYLFSFVVPFFVFFVCHLFIFLWLFCFVFCLGNW